MKQSILVAALTLGFAIPLSAQTSDDATLRSIEQALQTARLNHDVATLEQYTHDDYLSINQTGNQRSKAEMLQLFKTFPIQSLKTDVLNVRITGDTAMVTGVLNEVSGTGSDRLLFMHTYVRNNGSWKLYGVMQSVADAQAPYSPPIGRTTAEYLGNRVTPAVFVRSGQVTTPSGVTAEEVHVGNSCVVVIRSENQLATSPCNAGR